MNKPKKPLALLAVATFTLCAAHALLTMRGDVLCETEGPTCVGALAPAQGGTKGRS